MTSFPHIQADPNWQVVTGPDIGPAAPKLDFTQISAGIVPVLLMDITGVVGKYADGVCRSADYPLPQNVTSAVLTATFALSAESLLYTQATEVGFKLTTPKGMTLNGQIQLDWGKSADNMTLDLTSTKGSGWAPTPVTLPKFTPNTVHTMQIHYQFGDADISVIAVEIDGVVYPTPAEMLRVPGKELGWKPNQWQVNFQPNTNDKGGNWKWMLFDVNMQFS